MRGACCDGSLSQPHADVWRVDPRMRGCVRIRGTTVDPRMRGACTLSETSRG